MILKQNKSKIIIGSIIIVILTALLLFNSNSGLLKNIFQSRENNGTGKTLSCTISVSCETILNNKDCLNKDKIDIIPQDGWIIKPVIVQFKEGETVFDILKNICRERKIHMEFNGTPIYDSVYIEGIGNIYEYDCGSLSGWIYNVNGEFPNYGCSSFILKDGDIVSYQYTCDLGEDIGGNKYEKTAYPAHLSPINICAAPKAAEWRQLCVMRFQTAIRQ